MATFGIDLGTTYTCVARLDDQGRPEVIRNDMDDTNTVASVVYFESLENIVVGEAAKEYILTHPQSVVQLIKREIGKPRTPEDPLEHQPGTQYAYDREFHGETFTPTMISSLILKHIAKMVQEQTGETVEDVVITCPAYFGLQEREATREAGELAGFRVHSVINEPTAASLSYCAREFQDQKTILVSDTGGGTFDVSIIKMKSGEGDTQEIEVVATGGDDHLGGADWDQELVDLLREKYCAETGMTAAEAQGDVELAQLLASRAEHCKKKLSKATSDKVTIDHSLEGARIEVTRAEFEQRTEALLRKSLTYITETMGEAAVSPDEIDVVLLVGGSSKMPMIRNAMEGLFPGKVRLSDPDLSVAKGAALFAGIQVEEKLQEKLSQLQAAEEGEAVITEETIAKLLEGEDKPQVSEQAVQEFVRQHQGKSVDDALSAKRAIRLTDVAARSFGAGILGENLQMELHNLIQMDSKVPLSKKGSYEVPRDGMQRIRLRVYESKSKQDVTPLLLDEHKRVDPAQPNPFGIRELGFVDLPLEEGTPAHTPVDVTFSMNSASQLEVEVLNLSTGNRRTGTLTATNAMTPEEYEQAKALLGGVETKAV